jgi:cytochrome c oxidase subunit 3
MLLHLGHSWLAMAPFAFSVNDWADPNHVFNAFPFAGHANLPLAFVSLMTFILIFSSVTMVLAVHAKDIT